MALSYRKFRSSVLGLEIVLDKPFMQGCFCYVSPMGKLSGGTVTWAISITV